MRIFVYNDLDASILWFLSFVLVCYHGVLNSMSNICIGFSGLIIFEKRLIKYIEKFKATALTVALPKYGR